MTSDKSPTPKRIWRFFARLNVAAVLIAIVLLLAALGSFFPQLSSSVAADPERLARWETIVRARYGALTNLLAASGAFRCFRSPVFLVPVALLALATLVCTLDRWRRVWRRAFHQPVRCSDTAPHTASLTAPDAAALPHIVRECLERRGFRVQTEVAPTNQPSIHLRGDRYRLSPLATLVTHLAVLLLLVGVVLSNGYGWREQITIKPGETAEVGHGSGLALRYEGFTVARYPDGSVASYETELSIAEEGREVKRGRVRVNEPLTYGPVGLYLQSYAGIEGHYSVTLLAVRDPGYGLVITAGFLLLLGLTVSFNFPHCWVHARIKPQGTLRLAGRVGRRACDFGREFEALVKEIGVRCSH